MISACNAPICLMRVNNKIEAIKRNHRQSDTNVLDKFSTSGSDT